LQRATLSSTKAICFLLQFKKLFRQLGITGAYAPLIEFPLRKIKAETNARIERIAQDVVSMRSVIAPSEWNAFAQNALTLSRKSIVIH
jgi:hypothetical protein